MQNISMAARGGDKIVVPHFPKGWESTLPEVSRLVAGVSGPESRLRGFLVHQAGWGNPEFPVVGARYFHISPFIQQ